MHQNTLHLHKAENLQKTVDSIRVSILAKLANDTWFYQVPRLATNSLLGSPVCQRISKPNSDLPTRKQIK
jgi:hypothetical protein